MNLSKRQLQALKELRYFIPSTVDWKNVPRHVLTGLNIDYVKQSRKGVSAREAFFLKSDQGVNVETVRGIGRYAALLSAQRWMAAHEKMWREGFFEGTLHPHDFLDEPDHVFRLAAKSARTAVRPFALWRGVHTTKLLARCKQLAIT